MADSKVDLLLSQSKWANPDEIPNAMFFSSRPQSENGHDEQEEEQRAADRLDTLLSNIEKRAEKSHEKSREKQGSNGEGESTSVAEEQQEQQEQWNSSYYRKTSHSKFMLQGGLQPQQYQNQHEHYNM